MTSINGKNKPFLTYKEQIEKLRNEKKLQIEDEDKAIEMLKRHSYFALVSGYKCPFKKKDGTYQPHTSLDDIYALYPFDNERLYDYMYRKGSIKDSFVHDYLQITKRNGVYQKGKSDLFAVLICLKYLLTEEEIIGLVNEIRHLLDELYKATKRICPDQMRKYMGFPVNWEQIKDCPFHKEESVIDRAASLMTR